MKFHSNWPLVTFALRQWELITICLFTNWLCMTEIHFSFLGKWRWDSELGGLWAPATPLEFCGPLLWAVPFCMAAYLVTLLNIHLHFRQTIDADINDGSFVTFWRQAPFDLKLKLIFAAIIGGFIGICILLSPLARSGA